MGRHARPRSGNRSHGGRSEADQGTSTQPRALLPTESTSAQDYVVGKTVASQLFDGQPLLRPALKATAPATTLTVPLTSDQAPRIVRGQRIELWLSSKTCRASVVLPSVAVQDVQTGRRRGVRHEQRRERRHPGTGGRRGPGGHGARPRRHGDPRRAVERQSGSGARQRTRRPRALRRELMKLPVLTAAEGATWEAGLVVALERGDHGVAVVRRCVDVVDLLAVAVAGQARAALVAAGLRRLDADAVDRLVAAGVVPVGVVRRGDVAAEDRLRATRCASSRPRRRGADDRGLGDRGGCGGREWHQSSSDAHVR